MPEAVPAPDDAPAAGHETVPEPVRALGGTPWAGRDAAEAQRITAGQLGEAHWPVLPELPDRGPGADAVGRSAALLAELSVDLQPHGWRVSPPAAVASGMDRRRARSWWREDAHRWADTVAAAGAVTERLAVRVLGPLTLLGSLWLPGGERVLVDAGARRDVAEAHREGLAEALAELRAATGAARLGVVLDEPLAAPVLAGELATASGYRTVRSMPRDEARAAWRAALADLLGAGADHVWLDPHARDADVRDLALLTAESLPPEPGAVALTLGVGGLEAPSPAAAATAAPATPAAWEVVAGWAEAGRGLALAPAGVGPLRPADVLATWDRLGLDPALARGLVLTARGRHDGHVLARLRTDAGELGSRIDDEIG